jgi:hypothetical protein
MEALRLLNEVNLAFVPTIVLTCMELRLAAENVKLLAVRFPTLRELIEPFSATSVPVRKLDIEAVTVLAISELTVIELATAVAYTTSPANSELISRELIIPVLNDRSRATKVLTSKELIVALANEAEFVTRELTARELREPYSKFMSNTFSVLTRKVLIDAFVAAIWLTDIELIEAVLMEALLMNATLVVRVLAIKVLVLTNSPKIAPLIVLMVRELMTASLSARERRANELTLKELTSSLLNIP